MSFKTLIEIPIHNFGMLSLEKPFHTDGSENLGNQV